MLYSFVFFFSLKYLITWCRLNRPSTAGSARDEPAQKIARQEAADETLTDFLLPSATDEDEPELSEPEYKRQRIASASGTEDLDPEEPQEVGALLENQSKRSNKKSAFLPSGSQQKSHGFWREPLLAASTQAIPHVRRPGKFDICEVYSQPRVTTYAAEGSLRPGWSLDICGKDGITKRSWDLRKREDQDSAFDLVRRDKPYTVVLSPPCTKFCALQNLRKNQMSRQEWLEAVRMINVAVKIAEIQLQQGRHFVFEHPLTASSWRLPSLRRLRDRAGVFEATVHMCMFGLETTGQFGATTPAMKPTRILTSSMAVRDKIRRTCDGSHSHAQLVSGRAAAAQEYTPAICRSIVEGVQMEILCRGQLAVQDDQQDVLRKSLCVADDM